MVVSQTLSTQKNLNWVQGALLCSPFYAFVWLCASAGLAQTSSSLSLFPEPLFGPWACSKPRQDDPLSGQTGQRHSMGGKGPRRTPAVPGLAERWWVLTGQPPRHRVLKMMFGCYHWTLGHLFLPHHQQESLMGSTWEEFKLKNNSLLSNS